LSAAERALARPRADRSPALVAIVGLPGSGKSTIAEIVARRLGAVLVSVDPVESAMVVAGLPAGWESGVAAYEVCREIAERNLALGQLVIADSVSDSEPARNTWRRAAAAAACPLLVVEVGCPDPVEHRRRVTSRSRGFAGVPDPTWEQVQARAAAYQPWADEERIAVDSLRPPDEVAAEICEAVAAFS
jgi:predicted kinase